MDGTVGLSVDLDKKGLHNAHRRHYEKLEPRSRQLFSAESETKGKGASQLPIWSSRVPWGKDSCSKLSAWFWETEVNCISVYIRSWLWNASLRHRPKPNRTTILKVFLNNEPYDKLQCFTMG